MNHMDMELYNGIISGNNEVLVQIDGRPSVVDQLTPTNNTILHLASQYGNLGCVAEILSAHPSLLLKLNSRGETPLHLAARAGKYGVAKTLLNAAKSSLLQLDDAQTTSSTVVELLIRTNNVEFDTALHEAVRYNRVNLVELLVTEDPNHVHPPNKNDESPLYMASLRGYKDIVTIILDNCVSPVTYGGPGGRTALHAAILTVNRGIIVLLLQKTCELIKVTDNNGWTSFHYAACNNYHGIIKYLIEADKSVAYVADKRFKRIALHIAAYRGYVEVAKELLKYCPDSYDIVDGSGRNILHIAVQRNKKRFIEYVLEDCKQVNNLLLQKDKHGNTPLHEMTIFGCYVPQVFDHNQVDLEALNGDNMTPLDLIYSGDNEEYIADQEKVRHMLIVGNAKRTEYLGPIMKEQDYETGKVLSNYINKTKKYMKIFDKVRDTDMIVAALIATVALTAGFAMPGVNQGSPILFKKAAFKTFVVTDTIALLCSLSSLFIYFVSVFYLNFRRTENLVVTAMVLNILSIVSMMMAFITGMYVVLVHSLPLVITVIVITLPFLFLIFSFLKRIGLWKKVISEIYLSMYYYFKKL